MVINTAAAWMGAATGRRIMVAPHREAKNTVRYPRPKPTGMGVSPAYCIQAW